jgi:hypothetical protein
MERRRSMAEWLAEQFIPGFSDEHRSPIDPRSFRAYGHAAARILGGKFIHDPLPTWCQSYTSALVTVRDATTRVLLHDELPLLAFAVYHPGDHGPAYEFIDAPSLARAFGEAFVTVPKSALDAPVDLLALERAVGRNSDIQYWTPRCLGHILYNCWD